MATPSDSQTRSRARLHFTRLLAASRGPQLSSSAPRRLSLRGVLRAALGVFGLLAILVAIGAAALVGLLARGPISIDQLNPQILANLEERFGHRFAFSLGPSVFEHSENGLGFALRGVSIRDSAGRTIVAAPHARIGFDGLALFGLSLKVKRLELDAVDVRLRVLDDGSLEIAGAQEPGAIAVNLGAPAAAGPATSEAGPAPLLGLFAAQTVQSMTQDAQTLDHIQIARGRLEIENVKTQSRIVYEKFDLNFERAGGAATIAFAANGPSGPLSFSAHAGKGGALTIEAHDLSLDELRLFDRGQGGWKSAAPLSFHFDIKASEAGALQSMSGRFSLGAGVLAIGPAKSEPIQFDELTGGVLWEAPAARYRFESVQILAGQTHWLGSGWIAPPDSSQKAWAAEFQTNAWELAPERAGDTALKIDEASLQAHYFAGDRRLALDNIVVKGAGLEIKGAGSSTFAGAGPSAKLNLAVSHSAVASARRVWPKFIRPDIRQWALDRLHGGEIVAGSLSLDWDAAQFEAATHGKAVPVDSIHGDLTARDALVEFLPGLPSIALPEVNCFFTGREVKLTAKRGALELTPARRIQASDMTFAIPDTSTALLVPAQASAHVQGQADALAELFGRDAMKPFASLSLDPATVKGQFDGALIVKLGLGGGARPEDASVHAEGTLANLQIEKFLGPERLEQGALTFTQDTHAFKIKGEGKIAGAPATIELSKSANDEGSALINLVVDNAERVKRGWNLGPTINGPEAIKIKAPLSRKSADVEIDLTKVAIDNPIPGFSKPGGKPGKVAFSVKNDSDGVHIANLVIEAGTAAAKGVIELDDTGAFVSAKLSQARLSATDDFKADIAASDSGLKIAIRGAALDARALLKSLTAHGLASGSRANFEIDLKVANAAGANRQVLRQFELTASHRNGALAQLSAKGALGTGPITVLRLADGTTTLHAGDAGALVKFFDFYPHMEGGSIDLDMKSGDAGDIGQVNVKDFVLRDEPAMRQLLNAGQSQGKPGAPVNPNVVRFEKLTTQFTRTPGRVELRDAAIFNSDMGLTTQGFIDYAQNRVDINGIFVPAYQVNNLLTHIPILGLLLGGGPHEGVFGMNYRIVGPASAPVLNINPLSAIAPGFLRKIFGVLDGTSPQTSQPPAAR